MATEVEVESLPTVRVPKLQANSKEFWEALRAEFSIEDLEFRVGRGKDTDHGPRAMVLTYVTARAIHDRLDAVLGPANWKIKQRYVESKIESGFIGTLWLRIDGEWLDKDDGSSMSDIEPFKGGLSGALKRAAVPWGIGRYLYDLPSVWIPCKMKEYRGKKTFIIDPVQAAKAVFKGYDPKVRPLKIAGYEIAEDVLNEPPDKIPPKQKQAAKTSKKQEPAARPSETVVTEKPVILADFSKWDTLPTSPIELFNELNKYHKGQGAKADLFHNPAEIFSTMGKWADFDEPEKVRNYMALAYSAQLSGVTVGVFLHPPKKEPDEG